MPILKALTSVWFDETFNEDVQARDVVILGRGSGHLDRSISLSPLPTLSSDCLRVHNHPSWNRKPCVAPLYFYLHCYILRIACEARYFRVSGVHVPAFPLAHLGFFSSLFIPPNYGVVSKNEAYPDHIPLSAFFRQSALLALRAYFKFGKSDQRNWLSRMGD